MIRKGQRGEVWGGREEKKTGGDGNEREEEREGTPP